MSERTPDDAMIKSWIGSLELLSMAVEAAVSYSNYLDTQDGIDPQDESTTDELYLGKIRTAKKALKELLHE